MIVEDDEIISNSIAGYLNKWQYTTHEVSNFQNVITEFVEEKPDIVLMDINLPYFDGYYFCEEIRKISKVPIIFISSASDDMNIVMAMNIGADDFIEKPFKLVVLKAKIEALLRRVYNFNSSNSLIVYKEVIFDINKDEIKYKDNVATLTKNESKILTILLENREKIVSREDIIAALWQSDNFIDENTEFVPASHIYYQKARLMADSRYTHFLKMCKLMGIDKTMSIETIEDYMDKMIAADKIIGNDDRHFGNFGFIRNVETGLITDFAPLFDSGSSFCKRDLKAEEEAKKMGRERIIIFQDQEERALKKIIEKYDLEKVIDCKQMFHLIDRYPEISLEKKEEMKGQIKASIVNIKQLKSIIVQEKATAN